MQIVWLVAANRLEWLWCVPLYASSKISSRPPASAFWGGCGATVPSGLCRQATSPRSSSAGRSSCPSGAPDGCADPLARAGLVAAASAARPTRPSPANRRAARIRCANWYSRVASSSTRRAGRAGTNDPMKHDSRAHRGWHWIRARCQPRALPSAHDRHRLHPHHARAGRRRALRFAAPAARGERPGHEPHDPRPGPARAHPRSRAPGGGVPRLGGRADADRRGRAARPRARRARARRARRSPAARQPRAGTLRDRRSWRHARGACGPRRPRLGVVGGRTARRVRRRRCRCPKTCPKTSGGADRSRPRGGVREAFAAMLTAGRKARPPRGRRSSEP